MTKLRLAAGRRPLWRHGSSLQLGLDPRHALIIDDLAPPLAELVSKLDGRHATEELIVKAEAAGVRRDATNRLLDGLAEAGLVEPAEHDAPPTLGPDATSWSLRTGRPAAELLTRRATAAVEVHGSGRIAVGVATMLAAAGVGSVSVSAEGMVTSEDVGTGYRPQDIGRPRRACAAAAVRRLRAVGELSRGRRPPDVVVLADGAAWDPVLAFGLVGDRVPHLAVHGREASVVVGPLVLPGRTSCLRCADLYRAEREPCWPLLAAQLASRPPAIELACAHVAAAMAVEQVLALLTGRGVGPDAPPVLGTTFEFDPLLGSLVRRRWPVHPRCDCGAPPDRGP